MSSNTVGETGSYTQNNTIQEEPEDTIYDNKPPFPALKEQSDDNTGQQLSSQKQLYTENMTVGNIDFKEFLMQ